MRRETFTPDTSLLSLYGSNEYQRLLRKDLLAMVPCKAELISLAVEKEVKEAERVIEGIL